VAKSIGAQVAEQMPGSKSVHVSWGVDGMTHVVDSCTYLADGSLLVCRDPRYEAATWTAIIPFHAIVLMQGIKEKRL
jgi:hypothetical protein